jgi:hypothetical protein
VALEPLLLLEPVFFREPDAEPLVDLLLLDVLREDDDREPEEREELLFLDLPLDFEGIGSPFLFVLLFLVR